MRRAPVSADFTLPVCAQDVCIAACSMPARALHYHSTCLTLVCIPSISQKRYFCEMTRM